MPWLKYYADERERHPALHLAKCTPKEAVAAIAKLCRHFSVKMPQVDFTSGNRASRAGSWRITLNVDRLTWLLVAHEFAHTWHCVDKLKRIARLPLDDADAYGKRKKRIQLERGHGKRHAQLVDRVCAYILKKGWVDGELKPKERPAKAPPTKDQLREKRIAVRAAQVGRLQRRIKALNTRLVKAKRSLAMLQLARQRGEREAAMIARAP